MVFLVSWLLDLGITHIFFCPYRLLRVHRKLALFASRVPLTLTVCVVHSLGDESVLYVGVFGLALETKVVPWLLNTENPVRENTDENPSEEENPPRLSSFEFEGVPYES